MKNILQHNFKHHLWVTALGLGIFLSVTQNAQAQATDVSATALKFENVLLESDTVIQSDTPFQRQTLSFTQSAFDDFTVRVGDEVNLRLDGQLVSSRFTSGVEYELATDDGLIPGLFLQLGDDAVFLPGFNQLTQSLTTVTAGSGPTGVFSGLNTLDFGLFPVNATVYTGQLFSQTSFGISPNGTSVRDIVALDNNGVPGGDLVFEDVRTQAVSEVPLLFQDAQLGTVTVTFNDGGRLFNVPGVIAQRLNSGLFIPSITRVAFSQASLRGRSINEVTLVEDVRFTNSNVSYADIGWTVENSPPVLTSRPQPNVRPSPQRDVYVVPNNGILQVDAANGLLANDIDDNGDQLTARARTTGNLGARNGTLTVNPDGSFVFDPDNSFIGTETLSIEVSDGTTEAFSTLAIIVQRSNPAGNVAPVAVDDTFESSRSVASAVGVPSWLPSNDIDANNDALSVSLDSGPTVGTVTISAQGSFALRVPDDYVGVSSFTYRVSDGIASDVGTVTATFNPRIVTNFNAWPDANVDRYVVNGGLQVAASEGVLANDSDAEDNPLTARVLTQPAYGTVNMSPDGSFFYTPLAGYTGIDTFIYQASDGINPRVPGLRTNDATVRLDVRDGTGQANRPPIAVDDAYDVVEGEFNVFPADRGLLINDQDPEGRALRANRGTLLPRFGIVTVSADGSFRYQAGAGITGSDTFSYEVTDGFASTTATVRLNFVASTPAPQPPVTTPEPPTPAPPTTPDPEPPTPPGDATPSGSILYSVVSGVNGFADEDIIIFDPATGSSQLYFDGSDVGLSGADIDALAELSDGSLLISLNRRSTVSGINADDSDVLRFVPDSLGQNTTGSFSLYIDGSDLGLTRNGEDIDSLSVLSEGGNVTLVVGTVGSFRVSGLSGADEDLAQLTLSRTGTVTRGTWASYLDGSDVGLTSSNEDVWGVSVVNGSPVLNTRGNYSVSGLSGSGTDLISCSSFVSGSRSACTFTLEQAGSTLGVNQITIDALSIR